MSRTGFVASAVVLVTAWGATAQDVRWRHDVAAARKEAAETGKPLLLDFGTESCGWCRKMDATTMRDPAVVKALNERFVPVKVDGNREDRLASALGIEAFPTLVLAAPDGKVLDRHTGYADPARLLGILAKAPAPAPKPAPVAAKPPAPRPSPDDDWKRAKAKIDADLTALFPEIAAGLPR